jgi:hypothetical protein
VTDAFTYGMRAQRCAKNIHEDYHRKAKYNRA